MSKITDDFVGNETTGVVQSRLTAIAQYWRGSTALNGVSTWGGVRSVLNGMANTSNQIAEGEVGSSFLAKLNWLNEDSNMVAPLFAASEPGQLSEVNPAYLYTDTEGTTPVTAPGQSVALWLDQSKGLALGSELVTNGTFDGNVAGWAPSGASTVVWENGAARWSTAVAEFSGLRSTGFSTVVGRTYEIRASVLENTGASWRIVLVNGDGTFSNGSDGVVSAGALTARFVATQTTSFVEVRNFTAAITNRLIDNISVRELPGNHDTQATVGSRPIYGKHPANGYRNMLACSEKLDDATWFKSNTTVTADAATAPDATLTAEMIQGTATAGQFIQEGVSAVSGSAYTFTIYAKMGTNRYIGVDMYDTANHISIFDLQTGTVTTTAAGSTVSITSVGNGWYRIKSTRTVAANFVACALLIALSGASIGPQPIGASLYVWGGQFEAGSAATAYQRTGVSSGAAWPAPPSYDITEAGQPDLHYLHFNGVSSFMVSPTITPGTDKVQTFVGLRKLSDAAAGLVFELGTESGNIGSMRFEAPRQAGLTSYRFTSRGGNLASGADSSNFPAPDTAVITGLGDIFGDSSLIRRNGVGVGNNLIVDQGTGNYLAYPIYTGRRAGTSLPLNGLLYSKIVRFGPNLTADQIASTERWVAQRTGISI